MANVNNPRFSPVCLSVCACLCLCLSVSVPVCGLFVTRPVLAESLPPEPPTPDPYAMALAKVRRQLPSTSFTALVEKPFIVAGDAGADAVRVSAGRTVRWAVKHLKKLYFSKDPDKIITIWLFKDGDSYRKHAKLLFDDEPDTPYGYYSPTHHALVMNIATGGGTLVHEIVHPFVRANFPDCPDWLNEGLGSLYEQSSQRDGQIVGLTNWRLAGLQEAIKKGKVPSFRWLMEENKDGFYEDDPGTNYAQARYLCYYLQETGRLKRYYHALVAAQASDPTGIKTLKKVLETEDLAAFQKKWEQWVLKLTFP